MIEHHPCRDIPYQGCGCLVLIGRIVEVNVSAPHLAVIFSVRAAGHQTIAEVDKAAQGHKGEENSLLQPHRVSRPGLLFEDASFSYMRAGRYLHPIQKDRSLKKSSMQFHSPADLAVGNRNRRLIPQLRAAADKCFGTVQLRSAVKDNPAP